MSDISEDKLREILAGTEGVTQGPWCFGAQWLCQKSDDGSYPEIAQVPINDYDSPRWNADAAHIARLDPDTVKAIVTELLALRHQSSEGATNLDDVRAAMRDMGWREIVIDYFTSPNPQTSGGE